MSFDLSTMNSIKQIRDQTCSPRDKKLRTNDSTKGSEVISVSSSSSESSDDSVVPFAPKDPSLWEVKKSICRYLIENGHDFSVAASPSFKKMVNLCSGNVECQIPTVKELKTSVFRDVVREMDLYVNTIKNSWADTGCSILLDEWTDPKGRRVMNVLMDCPKGTVYFNSYDVSDIIGDTNALQHFFEVVLREIGINNVVQVITNSSSSLTNELRMQLTDKFRSAFWTQSASCCIGLMLEKISTIDHIKETLDKAKIVTKFIYSRPSVLEYLRDKTDGRDMVKQFRIESAIPFVVLENLLLEHEILKSMFLSSDPMSSKVTSTAKGKKVAELIESPLFWSGVLTAVEAAMPLVRLIGWMDENNKAQICQIYEKINQAKKTIKGGFFNQEDCYMPYWDIIEDVRSEELHSPLHSAGYFLNPSLFYSSDFVLDPKVATDLFCCVVRSTKDVRVQDTIVIQLEQYRNAKGRFSEGRDIVPSSISPVEWWSKYGKDCPELQRLAIRILSQACDGASRFRLNKNLAEAVTEDTGRNRNDQKKLSEMTYHRYNIMLQNYASGENSHTVVSEQTELFADEDIFPLNLGVGCLDAFGSNSE